MEHMLFLVSPRTREGSPEQILGQKRRTCREKTGISPLFITAQERKDEMTHTMLLTLSLCQPNHTHLPTTGVFPNATAVSN
jgi:hypothetical protein